MTLLGHLTSRESSLFTADFCAPMSRQELEKRLGDDVATFRLLFYFFLFLAIAINGFVIYKTYFQK